MRKQDQTHILGALHYKAHFQFLRKLKDLKCTLCSEKYGTTIYKMQKIIQLKDIYNLEVSKFMYKYTISHLPATFNNYFKLIKDFYPYNTRQIKTWQFALQKARSNSGAKLI